MAIKTLNRHHFSWQINARNFGDFFLADQNNLPTANIIGWVYGKIYRKPWFLPSSIGFSCKFPHHPILWQQVLWGPAGFHCQPQYFQVESSWIKWWNILWHYAWIVAFEKNDRNWMMKLDYAKRCFKNVGSKVSKNQKPAYLAVSAINLYIAHEGDPWTLAAHTGRGSWSDVSTFCIARKDGSAIIEVPSEGRLVFLYAIFSSNGNRKMLCRC